jgi:hypothetical protein
VAGRTFSFQFSQKLQDDVVDDDEDDDKGICVSSLSKEIIKKLDGLL